MENYHFVGIKGSGMSALANILHDLGKKVQGSDVETYYFTQKNLDAKGVPIYTFNRENIHKDHLIIAGNAFSDEHEEINEAKKQGMAVKRYHTFLGEFIQNFTSIAVSGAHGKTSTTGLLAHVVKQIAPTSYLIGDGTGEGEKNSEYFVFEACEYKRHFLAYSPDYAIVTNIDFDHPDYFQNLDDVVDAFSTFTNQVKKRVIAYGDDPSVQQLSPSVPLLRYGFSPQNDLRATDIRHDEHGTHFTVHYLGKNMGSLTIPLYGDHHILNTLAVAGVLFSEGMDIDVFASHLRTFAGVKRRFNEEKMGDVIMVDDYAHHPTEIKATLQTARLKYPDKTCVAIFQPHTFSRTKQFLEEFAESLSAADHVYLCDIFGSAREKNGEVKIQDLIDLIPHASHLHENNMDVLNQHTNAVLLFMGAGDIQKYQQLHKQVCSK